MRWSSEYTILSDCSSAPRSPRSEASRRRVTSLVATPVQPFPGLLPSLQTLDRMNEERSQPGVPSGAPLARSSSWLILIVRLLNAHESYVANRIVSILTRRRYAGWHLG